MYLTVQVEDLTLITPSLFITPCVPIMLLRTEAREKYNIQVDERISEDNPQCIFRVIQLTTLSVRSAVGSVVWSRLPKKSRNTRDERLVKMDRRIF